MFVFREDRIELGGMSGDGSGLKRDAASTSDAMPNGMVRQSSTVDDTSVGRASSTPWRRVLPGTCPYSSVSRYAK